MRQVIMSVLIFTLLSLVSPEAPRTRGDEVRNGLFSTVAFLLGALTSCLCGYLGMKIATYANARTAVEARRGIAPAFMTGARGERRAC
jgi:H+-translocating diphosphatase